MSIDNRIWVPAGARNDKTLGYTKYKCGDAMPPERHTRHQVFLAGEGNVLIDEQYFFEDEADARWFRVTRNACILSATDRQPTATE
jgi:hypothetical protein